MWKDKTCEKCEYRDKVFCRRFPPTQDGYTDITFGNEVGKYILACAEYKEPTTTEGLGR